MRSICLFSILVLAGCSSTQSQNTSSGIKNRTILVTVDTSNNTCIPAVFVPNPECTGNKPVGSLCAKPKQKVTFVLDGQPENTEFEIAFKSADKPFKWSCDLKKKGSTIWCKIRGDADGTYEYGISVGTCANKLDPHIYVSESRN